MKSWLLLCLCIVPNIAIDRLPNPLFVTKCENKQMLYGLRWVVGVDNQQIQALCRDPPVLCKRERKTNITVAVDHWVKDCTKRVKCLNNEYVNGFEQYQHWCCKLPTEPHCMPAPWCRRRYILRPSHALLVNPRLRPLNYTNETICVKNDLAVNRTWHQGIVREILAIYAPTAFWVMVDEIPGYDEWGLSPGIAASGDRSGLAGLAGLAALACINSFDCSSTNSCPMFSQTAIDQNAAQCYRFSEQSNAVTKTSITSLCVGGLLGDPCSASLDCVNKKCTNSVCENSCSLAGGLCLTNDAQCCGVCTVLFEVQQDNVQYDVGGCC